MPPPRKVDLLPSELKKWLQDALKERGFSGYEELAEDLNFRLEEEGCELRIRKSALHSYGSEYEEFVKCQDEASSWAAGWMNENGLEDEAQRHNVLFQMITALAFKVMQSQMGKDGAQIDPRDLHFIGKLMKDVMASSGIREKLMGDERARIEAAARKAAAAEMAETLEAATEEAGLSPKAAEFLRKKVLGMSK
ncbi:phage protein Gp27 family protein [Pseudophaeobacter sp.]|uniref:phage protein Gp27 family protein n=1 Tax=Pseudophaeobacter sp. TaxID=1971739 RepID=UPI003299B7FE